MDYFQKSGFPSPDSGIEVERSKQEEGKFSLFIKDDEQKVIGCGIYEPSIDAEELINSDCWEIESQIKKLEGFENFEKNHCFFFILADEHYYLMDIGRFIPKSYKQIHLKMLIDKIKTTIKRNREYVFNQMKSQITELSDNISEYESSLREKELLIASLRENIRNLEHYPIVAKDLFKENKKLNDLLNYEYSQNIINIDELRGLYNHLQIERLIKRPFLFGSEEEEKIVTISGSKTTKIKLVEIAFNLSRRSMEIFIRVIYIHHWHNSGGDGYPGGYYPNEKILNYYIINEEGAIVPDDENDNINNTFALINFSTKSL